MISISALTSCASGLAASLSGGDKPLFELRPGPFVQDEFVVLELNGQEAISTLSCFEVTVASRIETVTDLAGLAKAAFGTLGKAIGLGSASKAATQKASEDKSKSVLAKAESLKSEAEAAKKVAENARTLQ